MFGKRKKKDLVSLTIQVQVPLGQAAHFKNRLKALALDYGETEPRVMVSTPRPYPRGI